MAQLNGKHRLRAVAALTATLVSYLCLSAEPEESAQVLVVVVPFETLGDAPAAIAQTMPIKLAAILDAHPRFEARTERKGSEASVRYLLEGSLYGGEGERAFVALRLIDAKTAKLLWFENYDYRNISAELMAREILGYLEKVPPSAEGRGRLTTRVWTPPASSLKRER